MTGRIGTTVAGRLLIAAGWLLIVTPIVTLTGCQQSRPVAAGVEGAETVTVAETALPENQMVYPWSVVPGGVDSAKAMGKAMAADPVVGAHYAGLQPGSFHPERLVEKKQGYVSYRIRDKIYWTRRMVTLAAGEQVLTDGKTLVRGRCGNLFSETPREPVAASAEEPPEKKMDEPVRAAQLMPTPEMRAEAPVEIEKFENPKGFGESASVLPTPQPEEALPPVWVAGTGIGGPGGVMGIGGMGGGGASAGVPEATTPETPSVGAPPLTIPLVTPSTAFTIPPPLVLAALTHPPSTPLILEYPVFTPPELLYPPVLSPQPPQIWMPPVGVPPPSRPPIVENPPSGMPPTVPPPGTPPPGTPPPGTPPSGTPTMPPPGGMPPGTPPPGTPPSGPPPSGPPPFDPPPTTPPDVSVPEPAAWVLAVLGIGAILAGSWRRKS
jgi:hypothetical protein